MKPSHSGKSATRKKQVRKRGKAVKKPETNTSFASMLPRCFLATVIAAVLFLTLASLGAYCTKDPDTFVKPFSLIALFGAVFFGGFFSGKKQSSSLLGGTVNALLFIALMLLLTLFFKDFPSRFDTTVSILLYASLLPLSLFGSLIGKRKRQQ